MIIRKDEKMPGRNRKAKLYKPKPLATKPARKKTVGTGDGETPGKRDGSMSNRIYRTDKVPKGCWYPFEY